MGKIYTAICKNCNRLYNYDVGIGMAYSKNILLDLNNEFNILKLYKEKNRKEELINILKNKNYELKEGYGEKMCICDTCGKIYSRFIFKIIYEDDKEFFPTYKCHDCRKKLRTLKEDEILNLNYKCTYCNKKITFFESGSWD